MLLRKSDTLRAVAGHAVGIDPSQALAPERARTLARKSHTHTHPLSSVLYSSY